MNDFFSKTEQELFDDKVLSFRHGLIKPDPKIFELSAKRLNVKPAECILIDDRDSYCMGAIITGMRAIRYTSFQKLKNDLEKIL